jgi:hypothetical protein
MPINLNLEKMNRENGQVLTASDLKKTDDNTDKIQNAFNNIAQQSKTYSELQIMVSNNTLIAGVQYILTDYKTKYQQPTTNVIKESSVVESLVLTAINTNRFAIECSSLDYPQDIIYYDFTNNLCEDGTTSRNGFILRRNDTKLKINAPNDWRTMLWARYTADSSNYLIGTTLTPYSVWTSGNAVMGVLYLSGTNIYVAKNTNTPTSSTDVNVFNLVGNTITNDMIDTKFVGYSNGVKLYLTKSSSYTEYITFNSINSKNIYIGDYEGLTNNIFYTDVLNFYSENSFLNNTFFCKVTSFTFGNNCSNNVFGSASSVCINNSFGNGCNKNNFLHGSFSYSNNMFENNCLENFISPNSSNNTFGNSCRNNTLGIGCSSNTFGSSCYNNTLGNGCNNNTLGNGCTSNIVGSNKQHLFIKLLNSKDLSSLTSLESRAYITTIESRSDGYYVYWSLDSTNTPVYTVIP